MTEALSPNQVVAANLVAARRRRGWTQEQAADELAAKLGTRWSKAAWSWAERSVDGKRIRQFTADELVALSLAFAVPLGWWFLPPDPEVLVRPPDTDTGYGDLDVGDLLALTFADSGPFQERVKELLDSLGDDRRLHIARGIRRFVEQMRAATGSDRDALIAEMAHLMRQQQQIADRLATVREQLGEKEPAE